MDTDTLLESENSDEFLASKSDCQASRRHCFRARNRWRSSAETHEVAMLACLLAAAAAAAGDAGSSAGSRLGMVESSREVTPQRTYGAATLARRCPPHA